MLIRVEIPVDAPKIDQLLRQTFSTTAETELVHALRERGLLTLGMVAADDEGTIVGYVAFSPVTLGGEDHLWVGLAPLAVHPEWQPQEIGRELVFESLNTLNEFSYTAVVVRGAPRYYAQFGFVLAADYRLTCRWPDTQQALQICLLNQTTLRGLEGQIVYSDPFDNF